MAITEGTTAFPTDVNGNQSVGTYDGTNFYHLRAPNAYTVGVELTRPSDTTAYAANDAVSNSTSAPSVLTFAAATRVTGGNGYITAVRIRTDQKTNVAQFRIHFFSSSPTAINDNSAQSILYANKATALGYVDVGPLGTEDATASDCAQGQTNGILLPYFCAATSVFGLLETKTAFTPASGQKFYISVTFEQQT